MTKAEKTRGERKAKAWAAMREAVYAQQWDDLARLAKAAEKLGLVVTARRALRSVALQACGDDAYVAVCEHFGAEP